MVNAEPSKTIEAASDACATVDAVGGYMVSVSIWEIGVKIKKNKLDIGMSLDEYVALLDQVNIDQVNIDSGLWVESLSLDWQHNDPADRLIVAFARRKRLPIVTADKIIRSYYQKIIW